MTKRTKKAVFAVFVALQAVLLVLYVTNAQPVHRLGPISISALILYTAFAIVTRG